MVTGGRCERAYHHYHDHPHDGQGGGGSGKGYETGVEHLEKLFTATACKSAGGDWRGGHDVSGHVFMLVLASAVLVFEAVGVGATIKTGKRNNNNDGAKEKADTSGNEGSSNSSDGGGCWVRVWTGRFVYGIAGLSWWMLFMTAIWFHTWLEKVSVSASRLSMDVD